VSNVHNDIEKLPCLLRIRTLYPRLTKTEKRIADYVLGSDQVIYKAITEVARESRLGYGSIIRFCKRLGFAGFQDFKIHLSQDLSREKDRTEKGGRRDYLAELSEKATADIGRTLELLSEAELDAVVETILKARTILIVGFGGSRSTAVELEYRLLRFGFNAVCPSDNHLQRARASQLAKGDVAFLISFTGSTREIIAIGTIARRREATVIALTNFARSPVSEISDVELLTSVAVDPVGAEIASKVANDLVIHAVSEKIRTKSAKARKAVIETFETVSDRQL
jgi:RpiR family transcriptional regulator, carbohydrate utilization regulator